MREWRTLLDANGRRPSVRSQSTVNTRHRLCRRGGRAVVERERQRRRRFIALSGLSGLVAVAVAAVVIAGVGDSLQV